MRRRVARARRDCVIPEAAAKRRLSRIHSGTVALTTHRRPGGGSGMVPALPPVGRKDDREGYPDGSCGYVSGTLRPRCRAKSPTNGAGQRRRPVPLPLVAPCGEGLGVGVRRRPTPYAIALPQGGDRPAALLSPIADVAKAWRRRSCQSPPLLGMSGRTEGVTQGADQNGNCSQGGLAAEEEYFPSLSHRSMSDCFFLSVDKGHEGLFGGRQTSRNAAAHRRLAARARRPCRAGGLPLLARPPYRALAAASRRAGGTGVGRASRMPGLAALSGRTSRTRHG